MTVGALLVARGTRGGREDRRRRVGQPSCRGMTHDSRQVRPGDLFCCLRGERVDGHDFAAGGGRGGAAALLVERPLGLDVRRRSSWPTPARADGAAGGRVLRTTRRSGMTVVGVTGTNGKTTTTHLAGRGARARPAGRPASSAR